MKLEQKSLPPGCDTCRGASHVSDGNGNARRCTCERGKALAQMAHDRHSRKAQPKRKAAFDGRAAGAGEA